MRRDSKVELLKKVPLFSHCSTRELRRLAAITDEVQLREGRKLTRQGGRGREFFVLVEGSVEIRQDGRKVATLGAGNFFGEIALLTQAPRNATVTSTTPVVALVITGREFRALLREAPGIQSKILSAVAQRLA